MFRSANVALGMAESLRMTQQSLRAISLDDVRRALLLTSFDAQAAQSLMAPSHRPLRREGVPGLPRLSAVLLLIYPLDGALSFVLMRRTEYNGVHSGQISLPGGSREADETFEQTALRETYEEIGVGDPAGDRLEILGTLEPLYVPPSDFVINPFVGYLPYHPNWNPNPAEVAEVIEAPLDLLFDAQTKGMDQMTIVDGVTRILPFYRVGQYKVWGATAAILSEFEGRVRAIIQT
ncbi:MAG: CoA pyrophosphatase [Chloroflexota bacterium]